MAVVGRVWDQDQGVWDQVHGDMLHRCYSAIVGREFASTSSEGYELSVRSTS